MPPSAARNSRPFFLLRRPKKDMKITRRKRSIMKKIALVVTVSLLLRASWALGQTAIFSFDDTVNNTIVTNLQDTNPATNAATFNSGTGTFNIDIFLTFSGGTSPGYSLWLETEIGTASQISITNETYFTF